jgi:hypothetical protein
MRDNGTGTAKETGLDQMENGSINELLQSQGEELSM